MKQNKLLLLLLVLPTLLFGQTEHLVQPNTADPVSGAPNNYHFAYINKTLTQKNKLFLFFPGTGAVPFNYKLIIQHAANLGYHAIGLTYPNSDAINSICQSSTDTTCHSRARLEVFDGTDRHSSINVDVNNCIERRTLKLLQYLNTTFPSENWAQYFSGSQVLWNKVIVSGHSQGGGHAGIISKIKQVDRVVMFAAMDWVTPLNRNADWITWNGPSAKDGYYGFTHQKDEFVNFTLIQTTWKNYGMNAFGSLAFVDTSSAPFKNSHQLYTLRTPDNDSTQYHGSVVADAYTPLKNGAPIFAPVWTYLIEGNGPSSSLHSQQVLEAVQVYPNPANAFLHLKGFNGEQLEFTICNLQGQTLLSGTVIDNKIDISVIGEGMYFLNLMNSNAAKSMLILKE